MVRRPAVGLIGVTTVINSLSLAKVTQALLACLSGVVDGTLFVDPIKIWVINIAAFALQ